VIGTILHYRIVPVCLEGTDRLVGISSEFAQPLRLENTNLADICYSSKAADEPSSKRFTDWNSEDVSASRFSRLKSVTLWRFFLLECASFGSSDVLDGSRTDCMAGRTASCGSNGRI